MLKDLSTKLGQLFFVGFKGYTLTKKIRSFFKSIQPGGVIFFEDNIKDKKQVKKLIKEINKCIKIKPFIGVDQEGGSVERLRKICTSLPSVWGLSKLGENELLKAQDIIVSELIELGFNTNFSPVLDINSNPSNPIISTRSISNKPKTVSIYSSKIIKLFLKRGIVPVAKHFPGHGDTSIDSHLSLPIINKSKSELNKSGLIPFKAAITNKVPIIMVGHLQLPKIEKNKKVPASLSKNIISDFLINELGFKGLIITDELNMKGVTKYHKLTSASYKATCSGADLLLFNTDIKQTSKAYKYIKGRAKKNKELLNRINESYNKIIQTKKKLISPKQKHKNLSLNHIISHELAKKVTRWIKKDRTLKPLSKKEAIEVIYPISPKLQEADIKRICKEQNIKHKLIRYNLDPSPSNINKILSNLKMKQKILITYDIAARPGQKHLINQLLKVNPDVVVISCGLEYDIEVAPLIRNMIAAYSPNYISLRVTFEKLLKGG